MKLREMLRFRIQQLSLHPHGNDFEISTFPKQHFSGGLVILWTSFAVRRRKCLTVDRDKNKQLFRTVPILDSAKFTQRWDTLLSSSASDQSEKLSQTKRASVSRRVVRNLRRSVSGWADTYHTSQPVTKLRNRSYSKARITSNLRSVPCSNPQCRLLKETVANPSKLA
jgi:hypothetical protein